MKLVLKTDLTNDLEQASIEVSAHVESKRALITTRNHNKMFTYYIKYVNSLKVLENDPLAIERLQPEATYRELPVADLAALIVSKYDAWTEWAFKLDMLEYNSLDQLKLARNREELVAAVAASKAFIDQEFAALFAALPQ